MRDFSESSFSRQEMFIKYDKPCMKPLPGGEYTTCDYKAVLKVPNNYHIDYDGTTTLYCILTAENQQSLKLHLLKFVSVISTTV